MRKMFVIFNVLLMQVLTGWAQGGAAITGLSVKTFGASGDGLKDDTHAILAALAAAGKASAPVFIYFPAGIYRYSHNIFVNGLTVVGEGQGKTILEASNGRYSAWILTGYSPGISALTIRTGSPQRERDTHDTATGIVVNRAQIFSIRDVSVGPVDSAGILIRISGGTAEHPSVIDGCIVDGSLADGIHLTDGSNHIVISHNRVHNTGDDLIAVVSYRSARLDSSPCHDIRIINNQIGSQTQGRGISVVGGSNIAIESNDVRSTSGAGIYLVSESKYNTYGVAHIQVFHNTLTNVVNATLTGHGAIHLLGRLNPALLEGPLQVRDVVIAGNLINGTSHSGIYVGSFSSEIAIYADVISNAGGSGIAIACRVSDIAIGSVSLGDAPNIIESCGEFGVQVDPANSHGSLRITGVVFRAINKRHLPFVDAVDIGSSGSFSEIHVTDNRLELPIGISIKHFVESHTRLTDVVRNTANVTTSNYFLPD